MSKVLKKVFQPKTKQNHEKISEKRALELQGLRILQKNLVYVVGLSHNLSKPEVKINFYQFLGS